ncbi:MAG: branched-chain amino acid ABC transporter substrate-binding protein [Caldilineaceae bacterium]|nr:branched-chain amino acid ABC transporter substrate-binding protein [Caldilineaceae bacterium]MBP8107441.1 branched-chain amino acid ABC transporter substrate-binding protein [Caldilineaceae bacterium]MBP8122410.1 branched-chain amino acid ABC transporter substrate-binding protein [Caldilineaceae bacterium]MBP9074495.1 branched-chain amino acid ABC transporter substrate-binding protein [Caldilineaceae bacterium]
MKTKQFSTTLLLILSVLLSACGGSATPTKGDIAVYVAVPLSGFQANGGQTVLGGARLAAEEINRAGGLLGYRIDVRPLDDESDSDVAVGQVDAIRAAESAGDRVIGVIGHLNSGQTSAAMDLYQDMDFVVITPTASEQSLTERGFGNFFRVNANDAVQAQVDADFLVTTLGATKIAVVFNDTEYGQGLAKSLVQELGGRGAQAVVQIQVGEGQSKYDSEVAKIQAANPDAIFYAGYEIEAPFLRAALVRAGVTVPMLASDGAFLAATIDDADGTAEGLYVSAFAPSPRSVDNAAWFEAYQAVESRNPDTYSVNGYVAMQVLAGAVKEANKLDASAVADALRGNSFDTLIGKLTFAPNGDLTAPQIWIYQVTGCEFVQVK